MSKKTKKNKLKTAARRADRSVLRAAEDPKNLQLLTYSLPVMSANKHSNTVAQKTLLQDNEQILKATRQDILITVVLGVAAVALLIVLSVLI